MRGIIVTLCVLLTLMFPTSELCAQQIEDFNAEKMNLRDQSYKIGWFINPQPISAKSQPVRKLEPILTTTMFPYKAYVLVAALNVAPLKYDAPAGTEFVGLIAHYPVGCTAKPIGRTDTQKILLKSGTVFLCLVDSDRNGDFDKYFTTKRIAIGGIPATAATIPALPYREIDPKTSTLTSNFWLYLSYAKKQTVQIGFHVDKGDRVKDGMIDLLENEVLFYEMKATTFPFPFRLFGTQYRIDAIGDGNAQIVVEKQLSIAPIHLGETCCY